MTQRYGVYQPTIEDDVENYLIQQVELRGGRCLKGIPTNNRGMSDRLCFMPGGLLIVVEVKRPGKMPRRNQHRQLKWFRRLGFEATWLDTFAKVDKLMEWWEGNRKKYRRVDVDTLCLHPACPMRIKEMKK